MKIIFFLFLAGLTFTSCKQTVTKDTTQDEVSNIPADLQHYEDEIMKIHDDVMPEMSEIQRLSTRLRDIKSKAGERSEGNHTIIEGLDDALISLRNAEQGMMDWMKSYGESKARMTPDLMQTFYERELGKVTIVSTNMINAIDKANAWLQANPNL